MQIGVSKGNDGVRLGDDEIHLSVRGRESDRVTVRGRELTLQITV